MVWIVARHFEPAWRTSVDLVVMHSTENERTRGMARRVAQYFAKTDLEVSSHYVLDDHETIQCVSERNVAWAAPKANKQGIQIELVGFAKHTAEQWRQGGLLPRAAELVAGICKRWSIPVRLLTSTELLGLFQLAVPVTPELTAWAQEILRTGKPIGTIVPKGKIAARVEWHSWTWRNGKRVEGKFRGVTLYSVQKPRGITSHASVSQAFGGTHWDPGFGFPWGEFIPSIERGII